MNFDGAINDPAGSGFDFHFSLVRQGQHPHLFAVFLRVLSVLSERRERAVHFLLLLARQGHQPFPPFAVLLRVLSVLSERRERAVHFLLLLARQGQPLIPWRFLRVLSVLSERSEAGGSIGCRSKKSLNREDAKDAKVSQRKK